jgi:hypothetical protein
MAVGQASEEAVFEVVRELVDDGEYLDSIPGIPTPAPSGGGHYLRTADDGFRRIYRRGSPGYLRAKQAGLVEPLPALRTAPAEAVHEAETVIGYRLPPLLRRLYLEVGNGGFGPGYGILGLTGGHYDDTGRGALALYRRVRDPATSYWSFLPAILLPVCQWGCGIYSFIDCSRPEGPMWALDPNPGPVDQQALYREPVALAEWLDRWVKGKLYQPVLVQDPLTKKWRGATEQEYARYMAELDEPTT